MLQLLQEEEIADDRAEEYFRDVYRVICVGERPAVEDESPRTVRTTYLVDWEHLVHLLEDYTLFGEDIVEVRRVPPDQARLLRSLSGPVAIARA